LGVCPVYFLIEMKRLRSIKIAGKKLAVKYTLNENWGEFHADESVIYLHKNCLTDDKLYYETLCHELFHAVFHFSGISHTVFNGDPEIEEGVVRVLENLMLPVLEKLGKEIGG
jgi:hypothetical protein